MVRVVGSEAVVPADAAEELELAALRRRAARDLGCDEATIERSELPIPVVRARGCGAQRTYLRVVRGYLPAQRLPADEHVPVEVGVLDFIDAGRAHVADPYGGLEKLEGELRDSPYDGKLVTYRPFVTALGDGFEPSREPDLVRLRLLLDVHGAIDLHCPRDEVFPLTTGGVHGRRAPRVLGCGRGLAYLFWPSVDPYASRPPQPIDPSAPSLGFRPWVPAERGYHGPAAATLHLESEDPGSVAVAKRVRTYDASGEAWDEWFHVCNAPCDLPVDPREVYRVEGPSRTRYVVPSAPFELPRDRTRVTAVVKPGRHYEIAKTVLLIVSSAMIGGAATLAAAYADPSDRPDTGLMIVGTSLVAIGALSLGGYAWLALDESTSVRVGR
jgi:hypothetical protein